MTAPPREPLIDAIRHAINCHSAENASNTPDYILARFLGACLAAFNTATQQRETWYGRDARPSLPAQAATDDLVQRLRVRSINACDAPFALRNEAADTIERQAREIADERKSRLSLREELSGERDRHKRTTERAERAEAELHKANIDSANMMAECSDMSVDIEKYRGEIAALRMAVKDDAQWAQENERLTRERDEWKLKYGDANEWGLRHAAAWKERAERAEAAAKEANERAHNETERRLRAEAERDAMRECAEGLE